MQKFFWWILAVVWAVGIFYVSHQTGYVQRYDGFTIDPWMFALRKLGHVIEFAVLTFFVLQATKPSEIRVSNLIIPAFLVIAYAISDEIHQTFVVGREGRIMDVVIDSLGILAATVLWFRWQTLLRYERVCISREDTETNS